MRALLTPLLLVPLCQPALDSVARAGDFTGFYAGVNAGYAFGRGDRRAAEGMPGPVVDRPAGAASDLPPSAAGAAMAMGRRSPGVAGPAKR